ncbi:hypothetical protein GCM10022267_21420 [Lentzea roselyniae]|uniref:Uncharacterized protein n=1 Tax=Lentzea roselyniae TaxID=531940 RepID=A0ABP7AL93_9PSEU
MNEFGFAVETHDVWSCDAVVPLVDGTPLTELIDVFEARAKMQPTGEMYAGFIADARDAHSFQPGEGRFVLACSCGDTGCWPLLADIAVEGDTVVWDGFRQPRRKGRDYSRFGPFRFDRDQYEKALAELG